MNTIASVIVISAIVIASIVIGMQLLADFIHKKNSVDRNGNGLNLIILLGFVIAVTIGMTKGCN